MSCPGSILAASILCTPPPASAPHNTPAPAPPVATGGAAASAGAGVAPPAGTATTGDAAGPTAAGASGREGRGDACNGVAGAGLQPHGQAAESEAGAGKLETEESRPAAGAATAAAGSGSVQAVRWKLNAEFKWRCQGPPEQVGPGAVGAGPLGQAGFDWPLSTEREAFSGRGGGGRCLRPPWWASMLSTSALMQPCVNCMYAQARAAKAMQSPRERPCRTPKGSPPR